MRLFVVMMLGAVLMTSCIKKKKETVQPLDTSVGSESVHEVTVSKSLQASAYTYLLVAENDQEYWIAVEKMDPEIGGTYFFANSMEMKEFKSNDLDTVFASVFFVQKLTTSKETSTLSMSNPHGTAPGRKSVDLDESIAIEPAEGGITIASLFENKATYSGKEVLVSGKVVKVNNGIMGRNWVHIQDGTNADGAYDLTLTTDAEVAVGDVVTMQGTVALDKDFGAGYFYDLIVEGAAVK
ncbi:GW dipeptide domain-containing protein [Mangrovibacterium lignilyticum]|uniref:GW dipeptide domain-containing protein n=1 Tax=Mangrovibacterium lignilyticum TaxID=2668052 RepID=UPI0013D0EACA|nr:GW dipeptide domain-containing protein [Mangrovibacterium lignilyticum]